MRAGAGDDTPLTPDELVAATVEVDAIVCVLTDRIDAAVLRAGAPPAACRRRTSRSATTTSTWPTATELGIAVCNTPGVLDETTADLAFFLMLAAARRTSDAEADLRQGRWQGFRMNRFLGEDVHGRTLGVVGFGRIGQAVARRAAGFGMQVLHHTRHDTGIDRVGRRPRRPAPRRRHRDAARAAHAGHDRPHRSRDGSR